MRLPSSCLVVLVGPSGAGKSYWAARQFRADQIVSSDALRALVGTAEHDQRAGTDAFAVLDDVLQRRLKRKLLTVVDTLGLDAARRAEYLALARRSGVECHAVVFDAPADLCRARNRGRDPAVPPKVLTAQLAARDAAVQTIDSEGFDGVHPPDSVDIVAFDGRVIAGTRLAFGLHLSSFGSLDGPTLAETVAVAERAGFTSIWVMDHLLQIPQVGRRWDDLPESWTTLGFLAAHTRSARIGTLVTDVALRHPAHLAKIVASLDVFSGGRAVCGIGLGWWEDEHASFGIPFPDRSARYALLEDALHLLPLMWGPGSPAFNGRVLKVAEATCYPRPLQEQVPILVGGSGPRTLGLAARYADACNVFGSPAAVRERVSILRSASSRPVKVTHLSTAVVAGSRRELLAAVARLGPAGAPPEALIDRLGAGTVEEQIGRYSQLADAGVETAMVALPDVFTPGSLEAFAEVIASFDPPPASW